MAFAKSYHMMGADYLPILIRDLCQTSGSFQLFRWELARLMQFIKQDLIATYMLGALKILVIKMSGHF